MYFDVKREYINYLLSLVEEKAFVEYMSNTSKELNTLKLLDEMISNLETVIEKTYPNKKINRLKKCIISNIRKIDDTYYTFDQDDKLFGKMGDAGRVTVLSDADILKFKEKNILHSYYL